ncbi:hypothetical protein C1T31_08820 [Hanstruepera neustonica]|uniref:N-acetyltransferase domain-containing protein n=1 Tax=Hanstruepera neustonica TaxID=1445657 RepID=A0A2K1DYI3_9FLAO|nr:GNAT family N-acetyltransferase [Hanstruepera neustonica]PNQ73082.1 hypothetical protein C1T31_08820 [Hanstruepera neustonica]
MITFKRLTDAKRFFELLPLDWQDNILPQWPQIQERSTIYVLASEEDILAGGIVFSEIIPEMEAYKTEAQYWFSQHYAYIGYVWVPLEKRHNNYGTLWLKNLLALDTQQGYWLTTEEPQLQYFYEKAGFQWVKTLRYDGVEENLFVSRI